MEVNTAIFFLEFLPRSRITCIDTFEGGGRARTAWRRLPGVNRGRSDANLAPYGDRVRKIKSLSFAALDRLAQDKTSFDLIYIDGVYACDDVLIDFVLALRLLAPNGICIWDDYSWGVRELPPEERPQQAIDAFLDLHFEELTTLQSEGQMVVAKRPRVASKHLNLLTFPRTPANLMRFLTRQPLHAGSRRSV